MRFILHSFLMICLFFSVAPVGSAEIPEHFNLDTLASRYEAVSLSPNWKEVSPTLSLYVSEATRQGDIRHGTRARTLRLYAFYNYGLPDSLYFYLPADLQFFADHEEWTCYYSCWSLKGERLQFDNKLQTALREAQTMYDDARKRSFDNGVGIAAYQIASCYQSLGRYEESLPFYREAEKILKVSENTGQLHNLYGNFWLALAGTGHYDEMLALADRWEAMWDEYARSNTIDPHKLDIYYLNCHITRVRAYREMGNVEKARIYLARAHACAEGQRESTQLVLCREEASLEEQCGNYEKALRLTEQRLRIQEKYSPLSRPDTEFARARLLRKLNRSDEAALILERLIEVKDSISQRDMAAQLDEVASLYKVDQYRLETSIKKQQLFFSIIGCGLLTLLLLVLVRGYYLLRRKNRILCEQLEQQALRLKYPVIPRQQTVSVTETSAATSLFDKLNELLVDEKLYLDTGLNRDILVERLGTNKNKLSEAILSTTGHNLTEYITQLRLQHALLLIDAQPDLSLSNIAEQSGFGVYSSFYRTFYKQYGVRPGEYRSFRKR